MNAHTDGGTILLVDDDIISTKHLSALLTAAGYTCIQCHSPDQALEIITVTDIDIGIFDLIMPETDGIELYDLCTHQQKFIGILYSAYLNQRVRNDAKSKGLSACLAKPTQSQPLLDVVQNLLKENPLHKVKNQMTRS